jgi:hypothetical protein
MANFRKSFNFRNGVQVDSDNFIVNPNGLVGIGTSIPSEALDLKGNAKISGLTTTNTFAVSSGATFFGNVDIGDDISFNKTSGIVEATSYRGDGSLLDGVIAIATAGFIVNLSGLHTFKSVGIGTSDQSYYLQIEGDPTVTTGVGITNGIVRASGGFIGDVTGDVTGTATTANNLSNAANITAGTIDIARLPASFGGTISFATTAFNLDDASNITTGTISDARLPATISSDITGTATTATNLSDAANITTGTIDAARLPTTLTSNLTGTATTATNLSDAANITTGTISDDRLPATISSDITGNALSATNLTDGANINSGTISDERLPDIITSNIHALSGVSTFVKVSSPEFIGNLEGDVTGNLTGTATTATNLSNAANITTGTIDVARLPGTITSNITGNLTGTATTATNLADAANITTGTIDAARLPASLTIDITGTATTATNLTDAANITTGTLSSDRLPVTPQFTSIGIGTDSPTDALHIQQSGAAEIYVGSDTDSSSLRVGRNLDNNDSGMVKYGNTLGLYPYSTEKSLDFMNFGPGNVNFYVEAGSSSSDILSFHWHRGSNTPLMSLTNEGNLGIGITNPTHTLNVQGISTFTNNAHFDQDVTIGGSLNFSAGANITATLIGDVQNSSSNVILDVSEPRVNANVFIQTGISTFNEVSIGSTLKSRNVVIGGGNVVRTNTDDRITVNSELSRFFVDSQGTIGISTTVSYGLDIGVNCTTKQALFSGVGIGTTTMRCAVDFADAGTLGVTTHTYLVPPKVSTSSRNGIAGTITGATIYNITENKIQFYNGTIWETLTSS